MNIRYFLIEQAFAGSYLANLFKQAIKINISYTLTARKRNSDFCLQRRSKRGAFRQLQLRSRKIRWLSLGDTIFYLIFLIRLNFN